MSTHSYARALVGGDWNTSIPLLTQETEVALPGKDFTLRANGTVFTFDFVDALSGPEITTLDTAVTDNQTAGPYPRTPHPRPSITLQSPDETTWIITVTDAGVLETNSV